MMASELCCVAVLGEVASLAPLGHAEFVFAAMFQWITFEQGLSAVEAMAFAVIMAAGLGVDDARRGRAAVPAKD